MTTEDALHGQWQQLRERLQGRQLLGKDGASLSLRIPGRDAMWFGCGPEAAPQRVPLRTAAGASEVHAAVYAARGDVGAVAVGGAEFGCCLADFGGAMPQVFDEQARHLGHMGPAVSDAEYIARSLGKGGNVLLSQGRPVCLGMTTTRLALNAELFEKCAKAYVLALASGARVKPLPWWVRAIANFRLHKDERRAAQAFARGELPIESRGY